MTNTLEMNIEEYQEEVPSPLWNDVLEIYYYPQEWFEWKD